MGAVEFKTLRQEFEMAIKPSNEKGTRDLCERWMNLEVLLEKFHCLYYLPDTLCSVQSFDGKSSPSRRRYYVMPSELTVCSVERIAVNQVDLDYRVTLNSFDPETPGQFLDLNIRRSDIRYRNLTPDLRQLSLLQIELLSTKMSNALGRQPRIFTIGKEAYEKYLLLGQKQG